MIQVINTKYGTFTHTASSIFIDITRPNLFGNPFIIGKDGNRREVIKKFKIYLYNEYENKDSEIKKEIDKLVSLSYNANIYLMCVCKPKNCHGDVIKELVENTKFNGMF